MISSEPDISVGIIENVKEVSCVFNGMFELTNSIRMQGGFKAVTVNSKIILYDDEGIELIRSADVKCVPIQNSTFTICDVSIGKKFHWERRENQTFEGSLRLLSCENDSIIVINEIGIENYLKSVISSEMSAEAHIELLKAHAVTSRSWLAAMLEKKAKSKKVEMPSGQSQKVENEIKRWYDREDHLHFDVCADDHCQRYQGLTKIISKFAEEAINATRGSFLVYKNEICDARFSKSCGGRTELFENCWEDMPVAYLQSISDSVENHSSILNEVDAERWILSSPDCYCNTSDEKTIKQILPSFDQETTDFFRWKVEYVREELDEIVRLKSGIDFGTIEEIIPLQRGPSGRICKLKIVGTKRTIVLGKELEIRRWLSKTHLYSSAFIVKVERDNNGNLTKFTFYGAGWGHGVGLCQIGAAIMAEKGFKAEEIVKHYFRGAEIRKLY